LAHCIGRSLIPISTFEGLLGGENGDEIFAETIEMVGQKDMTMQRLAAELSQDEDFPKPGVNTITDGNIDKPKSPGNRNRWFAPFFS